MSPHRQSVRLHVYYPALVLGGVETLLVRLSNWLVAHGHRVTLHLETHGELEALLDRRVECDVGGLHRVITPPGSRHSRATSSEDVTVVFAPDPPSLMNSLRRHRHRGASSRFLLGVYHPAIFTLMRPDRLHLKLRRLVFRNHVADRSVMFMNEACRARHRRDFARPFAGSMIVPTPLEDRGLRTVTPIRHKIVSVGRLVEFKTYNLYMLDVIEELVRRGHDAVEWHVYGYGELRRRMEEEIAARSLGDRVFLHGAVEYARFGEVVADAGVFVGGGTAMVEAALAGVPCVVGVESTAGMTYGRFDQLDGFDVGERGEDPPTVPVVDAVEAILNASVSEYRVIETASRRHGERFLIDRVGPVFIESALAAGPWRNPSFALTATVRIHDLIRNIGDGSRRARRWLVSSAKRWVPGPLQAALRRINRLVPH